ncbi:mitosis inhibitor protein kinase swe1 [Batrachochytrium dendrobatidis]|nr:mitosis inhibitor protein kinase swe1 [Batrachochytrium dendrobatidis]KAK5670305.1 mitosis inhibitor protein kinase swe1 [Batrachochytrium dendrobatidis]
MSSLIPIPSLSSGSLGMSNTTGTTGQILDNFNSNTTAHQKQDAHYTNTMCQLDLNLAKSSDDAMFIKPACPTHTGSTTIPTTPFTSIPATPLRKPHSISHNPIISSNAFGMSVTTPATQTLFASESIHPSATLKPFEAPAPYTTSTDGASLFTPQQRLVKPTSAAFHSTGVLSRKSRRNYASQPTPETPIKQRKPINSFSAAATTRASTSFSASHFALSNYNSGQLPTSGFNPNGYAAHMDRNDPNIPLHTIHSQPTQFSLETTPSTPETASSSKNMNRYAKIGGMVGLPSIGPASASIAGRSTKSSGCLNSNPTFASDTSPTQFMHGSLTPLIYNQGTSLTEYTFGNSSYHSPSFKSASSSKKHRSPLRDSPIKFNKRLHLSAQDLSPLGKMALQKKQSLDVSKEIQQQLQPRDSHELNSPLSPNFARLRWPLPLLDIPSTSIATAESPTSSDKSSKSNFSLGRIQDSSHSFTPFSTHRRALIPSRDKSEQDMDVSPVAWASMGASCSRLANNQEHISPIASKNRFSFANLVSSLEQDACDFTKGSSADFFSSTLSELDADEYTAKLTEKEAMACKSGKTDLTDRSRHNSVESESSPVDSTFHISGPVHSTRLLPVPEHRNGDSIVPKVGEDLSTIRPLFEPHTIAKPSRLPRPKSSFSLSQPTASNESLFSSHRVRSKSVNLHPVLPISVLLSPIASPLNKTFFAAMHGDSDAIQCIQKQQDTALAMQTQHSDADANKTELMPIVDYLDSHFVVIGRIGGGTFSEAVRVRCLMDEREYAVKKTRQSFQGHKDALLKLHEVEIWSKIGNNPWCISFVSSWIQHGFIYIQMELCETGDLATYLDDFCKDEPMDEPRLWRILADIARGLAHIHRQGIVHLDLKPGNIFISADGTLKIGDFGMAAVAPVPKGADREGDRSYLAPEVLTDSSVGCSADIFSLGLILLEIAANIILPENGTVWQHLREGDFTDIQMDRSPPLTDFIKSMMHPNPNVRPTIEDVLQHPILASLIRPIQDTTPS